MNEVQLTLTIQELDIIMSSMAEQPYKNVAGVIAKVMNQVNGGQRAPDTPQAASGAASAGTPPPLGDPSTPAPL